MKVAFVTDAPYAKDIRLQRTVEALQELDNFSLSVLSQGFFLEESKAALGDNGQLFPSPIPDGKIKRFLWHVQNRLFPMRSYDKRAKWTYETLYSIKPDIIHCVNPFALEACINASQRLNAKLVYEAYEYWPEYIFELGGRVPFRVATRIWNIEKRSAQFVSGFITVSEPLAQWYEFDSEPQHSLITYNVNSPDGSAVKPSESSSDTSLSLVYAGVLHSERNIDIAIDAVSKVDDVVLTIQGEGVDKQRLEDLARSLKVDDRITFANMVPADALVDSLAQYDLGLTLLSSKSKQMDGAIPNKVFDYMRAGLGILAVESAGLKSLKQAQDSIIYLNSLCSELLASQLQSLQKNKSAIERAKISSRENSRCYSRGEQIRRIQELYLNFAKG